MTTFCWSCVNLTIFVCFLFGLFYTIGYVELPVELVFPPGFNSSAATQSYLKEWSDTNPPLPSLPVWKDVVYSTPRVPAIQSLQTSLVIYILALLSFIGWILMSVFVGIGFITVPADLIAAFLNRPVPIDLKKFAEKKLELKKRCDELVSLGKEQKETFRKKASKFKERRFTNKFKKFVLDLEVRDQLKPNPPAAALPDIKATPHRSLPLPSAALVSSLLPDSSTPRTRQRRARRAARP
jgi:RNAse (barnase) inhibitor barstar